MAKTIINLTDPVSTLVTKSNTISSHLGDLTQLNVGAANDSDLVQAINFVNIAAQKTDSADIINLIDASYIQARQNLVDSASIISLASIIIISFSLSISECSSNIPYIPGKIFVFL